MPVLSTKPHEFSLFLPHHLEVAQYLTLGRQRLRLLGEALVWEPGTIHSKLESMSPGTRGLPRCVLFTGT